MIVNPPPKNSLIHFNSLKFDCFKSKDKGLIRMVFSLYKKFHRYIILETRNLWTIFCFVFICQLKKNDNMQLLLLWQYMKRNERGLSISPFIKMVDVARDAREMSFTENWVLRKMNEISIFWTLHEHMNVI